MRTFLFSFLLGVLILTPYSAAQQASLSSRPAIAQVDMAKYIGFRYGNSSPPDNLKNPGGAIVSEWRGDPMYAISEYHKGRVEMLWFERQTHRDKAGRPHWEVKDVLVIPAIRKNQIYVYATCYLEKQLDSEIVAIVDDQPDPDVEFITRVHQAWRANRKTDRFERISPKGIKCINARYGI